MGENTKIEWADHSWNPWIGCAKVSAGCQHCYAEALMDTQYGRAKWGVNGTRVRTSEAYWKKPIAWNTQATKTGERKRVFCASLADVFEDRPELESWRLDLFKLIEQTPNLDWLLLTKRPENVIRMIELAQDQAGAAPRAEIWLLRMPNVWLGTSVENQEQANKRIPHLLDIPARVRFLSMEPLLGPVDLTPWLNYVSETDDIGLAVDGFDPDIHWVIVGGESGPKARPMHPEWARSLRRQCQAAGVPFLFKQWGSWQLADYHELPNAWVDEDTGRVVERTSAIPERPPFRSAAVMQRADKHAAGRLLDGEEWNEYPRTDFEF